MTDTTTAADTMVEDYFAAWNESDSQRRLVLAEKIWTEDGRYVDPLADVCGPAAFGEMIGAVQERIAGHTVRIASPVEQHHDQLRFVWEFVTPDGGTALTGIDVCRLSSEGKFASVTGFFGTVPEGVAA